MANSTPIVDFESGLNWSRVKRERRFVLPTPESPIRTIFKRKSGSACISLMCCLDWPVKIHIIRSHFFARRYHLVFFNNCPPDSFSASIRCSYRSTHGSTSLYPIFLLLYISFFIRLFRSFFRFSLHHCRTAWLYVNSSYISSIYCPGQVARITPRTRTGIPRETANKNNIII